MRKEEGLEGSTSDACPGHSPLTAFRGRGNDSGHPGEDEEGRGIEDAGGESPAAPWEFVEVARSIESRDAARMPAIKWPSAHPATVLGLWVRVLMDDS